MTIDLPIHPSVIRAARAAKKTQARTVVREVRDGREIAHVPMSSGGYCVLDAADADRLAAAGVKLTDAYLTSLERGGPHVALPSKRQWLHPFVLLARLITGAEPHQRVRYLDRDRRNLCRGNLRVEDRRKSPALLAHAEAA